jgi:branched-chain amino acid transport system ATP-binding protein
MPLLELEAVEAGYGSIQILHGVSLHVDPGEVVAVIGPNGAGKSTAFKAVMGFITHLGGEIVFDGKSLVGRRPDRILALGLGYVPQGRVVFGQMTVRENLEMGAYLERDKAAIRASMERIFTLFPRLGERQRQAAGSLSGGEQQMLAMGRALMSKPRLLLMDEPSMGLAPILVERSFEIISQVHEAGVAMLVVEQNANVSLSIADRGYVLSTGRVVLEGKAADLLENEDLRKAYLGR